MKERPILFSSPMVRALLDGSKTQTRRLVKGQAPEWATAIDEEDVKGNEFFMVCGEKEPSGLRPILTSVTCPYGQPGDHLWVRENWHQRGEWRRPAWPGADGDDVYWSGTKDVTYAADEHPATGWRSRPSIHMPRWASRILLEIVSVRVERLQDISQDDACAEGITDGGCVNCGEPEVKCECSFPMPDYRDTYCYLWEQINGAGSWAANPWVWVIEFKRVTEK